MAVGKRAKAVCDICGFVYPHNVMKLNSYGLSTVAKVNLNEEKLSHVSILIMG